ncbi:hypothetical protein H0G86_000313 [Trichoderma simmonsii]|uniref:Uncharacterized protein n=1 Tax=Trichoderma simmonsii TaxID=1491479 RepID=A0A8G0KZE5_9HYPO|nr:hypothetical protein H0G86_000313 [Trichoderma simmonsii]
MVGAAARPRPDCRDVRLSLTTRLAGRGATRGPSRLALSLKTPRLRAKPNTHARMQRYSTQFNELDVTPNRPKEKAQYPMVTKVNASPTLQSHADELSSSSSSSLVFDAKTPTCVFFCNFISITDFAQHSFHPKTIGMVDVR